MFISSTCCVWEGNTKWITRSHTYIQSAMKLENIERIIDWWARSKEDFSHVWRGEHPKSKRQSRKFPTQLLLNLKNVSLFISALLGQWYHSHVYIYWMWGAKSKRNCKPRCKKVEIMSKKPQLVSFGKFSNKKQRILASPTKDSWCRVCSGDGLCLCNSIFQSAFWSYILY